MFQYYSVALPTLKKLARQLNWRGRSLVTLQVATSFLFIRQYEQIFSFEGCTLEFDEDSIQAIAAKSQQRQTGVRALRAILEDLLLDVMFELPEAADGTIFRVTAASVRGEEQVRRLAKRRKTGS